MIWSAPNGRLAWLVSSGGRAATAATCRDDLVAAKRSAATQDEGCLALLKPSSLSRFWGSCSPKRADPGARRGGRWGLAAATTREGVPRPRKALLTSPRNGCEAR